MLMIEDVQAIQTLCDTVREAIRADRKLQKTLPSFRRTERANLHHRLQVLVPVWQDTRRFLLQVRDKQSFDNFRLAPERLVSQLLSYFATGIVFIPADHVLWTTPLPQKLVQKYFRRHYTNAPFFHPGYRTDGELIEFMKSVPGETLEDYRTAMRTTDIETGKPLPTQLIEEVNEVLALKVRLQSILTPAEFDLLRRHHKALLFPS
jgi:hypothetical protein